MRLFVLFAVILVSALPAVALDEWKSFISAEELREETSVLLIDVRSEEEYRQGHIPGAVNIPGAAWRTPKVKPGQGDSQYFFYAADGSPDVARYERLLSEAGVQNADNIVVYGNHAGTTDGSVPVYILRWLGHEQVRFLDGIGVAEWQRAGGTLEVGEVRLKESRYSAKPRKDYLWTLKDVQAHLGHPQTVFYDTRSHDEFAGVTLKDNRRGGHIPGAVLIDYEDLLDRNKQILPVEEVVTLFRERGITPEKQIVLYCQTATRVTLPALALLDLGYPKVAIYDASWHEYGNRDDTQIASGK